MSFRLMFTKIIHKCPYFGKELHPKYPFLMLILRKIQEFLTGFFLKTAKRPLTVRQSGKSCHVKTLQTWYKCYRGRYYKRSEGKNVYYTTV